MKKTKKASGYSNGFLKNIVLVFTLCHGVYATLGFISMASLRGNLCQAYRKRNFLKSGSRHPGFPGGVAQFEHIPTGIKEINLAARKKSLLPIDDWLCERNTPLMEKLTGIFKHIGAYVKGVVKAIVLPGCAHEGFMALPPRVFKPPVPVTERE